MEPRGEGASEERGERKIPDQHSLVRPHAREGNTGRDPFFTCSSTSQNDSAPWAGFGCCPPPPSTERSACKPRGTLRCRALGLRAPPRISQEAGGAARRAGSLPPEALRPARRRGRLSSTARLIRGY